MDSTNMTIKQLLIGVIVTAVAFFVPEIQSGDQILDALVSFASFAPMVIFLSALINTRLQWEGTRAFLTTGLVSLSLGYMSFFLDVGFLASSVSLWWHPMVIGLGMFASGVLGFNYKYVKIVAQWIFDYSWKKGNQPG